MLRAVCPSARSRARRRLILFVASGWAFCAQSVPWMLAVKPVLLTGGTLLIRQHRLRIEIDRSPVNVATPREDRELQSGNTTHLQERFTFFVVSVQRRGQTCSRASPRSRSLPTCIVLPGLRNAPPETAAGDERRFTGAMLVPHFSSFSPPVPRAPPREGHSVLSSI